MIKRGGCGLRAWASNVHGETTAVETRMGVWRRMPFCARLVYCDSTRRLWSASLGEQCAWRDDRGGDFVRLHRLMVFALVAQGIEHWPPEPGAQVRILPRARTPFGDGWESLCDSLP